MATRLKGACAIMLSFIGSIALAKSDVVWESKVLRTPCFDLNWRYPASLVPIREAGVGATSRLTTWRSFDGETSLDIEPIDDYTKTDRKEYLALIKCEPPSDPKSNSQCKSEKNKSITIETSENIFFAYILVIFPDAIDRSRFAMNLRLSGPAKDQKKLSQVAERMWLSTSSSYKGCCKLESYRGCKA